MFLIVSSLRQFWKAEVNARNGKCINLFTEDIFFKVLNKKVSSRKV